MDSESTPLNPNELPPPPPHSPDPAPITAPSIVFDWRSWARRLLICNPFFLCSAALLLFGVNRLSIDPTLFTEDKANLFFNYSALQLYGFLVVGAAIVLARRKIWYDSALLVVVENGLVLVPFMLLSQGALLNPKLGMSLAAGAIVFTGLRAFAVRRWYPQFNLPTRALALGSAVLLLNAALAMFYPPAVKNDTGDWGNTNQWLWFAALPLLVAGANLLPKPTRYGGLNPERHWLPLFTYALWIGGTGTHFWCLAHISNLPFTVQQLGPAIVVAVWTMYRRITDCVPGPVLNWRRALLCLAFITPFTSFENPELFEALVLMNAIGFALVFMRNGETTRVFARELLVLCLPLAAVGLPQDVGRKVMPYFDREQGMMLAISLLLALCALRWFRLRLAVFGMFGVTVLVTLIRPGAPPHAFVQTAMLFLLTHSLAWRKDATGATFLRFTAGMLWLANSLWWVHDYQWRAAISVTSSALVLLAAWFVIWGVSKERPDILIAMFASAVSLTSPTDWLFRNGSAGLIALVASAGLFAIGFIVAWTRHRWERAHNAGS